LTAEQRKFPQLILNADSQNNRRKRLGSLFFHTFCNKSTKLTDPDNAVGVKLILKIGLKSSRALWTCSTVLTVAFYLKVG